MRNSYAFGLACASAVLIVYVAAESVPMSDCDGRIPDLGEVAVGDAPSRVRRIPEAKIARFRADPDFHYDRKDMPHLRIAEYLEAQLAELLRRLFRDVDVASFWKIAEYVLYACIGAILFYAAIRIIGAGPKGLFFSRKERQAFERGDPDADDATADFEALAERFEAEGDYRSAVRYLYRNTLRELASRGLIVWRKDKANREYARELATTPYADGYVELTRLFEYLWYGMFDCDAMSFRGVRERFAAFHRLLRERA